MSSEQNGSHKQEIKPQRGVRQLSLGCRTPGCRRPNHRLVYSVSRGHGRSRDNTSGFFDRLRIALADLHNQIDQHEFLGMQIGLAPARINGVIRAVHDLATAIVEP